MSGIGTGPKRRLSTAPASGLSDSSHQPPSARRAARLTMSRLRPARVPGEHDLAGADPAGAPDQQPVAGAQGGLHGPFGDLDPEQGPVHGSLQVSALQVLALAAGVVSGLQVHESEKGNR